MEELIAKLTELISLEYTFSVIIATYLLIKAVDFLNKEKSVTPVWRRVISILAGAGLFWVFKIYTEIGVQTLITSYLFAIFVYDIAIKHILDKLKIAYRKDVDVN